jgi:hypothetical protein
MEILFYVIGLGAVAAALFSALGFWWKVVVNRNATKLSNSAAECREEARRLRTLAAIVTTPALRQTLLDAAATYDKLAARSAASGRPEAAE